jgi:hypothetical protein
MFLRNISDSCAYIGSAFVSEIEALERAIATAQATLRPQASHHAALSVKHPQHNREN